MPTFNSLNSVQINEWVDKGKRMNISLYLHNEMLFGRSLDTDDTFFEKILLCQTNSKSMKLVHMFLWSVYYILSIYSGTKWFFLNVNFKVQVYTNSEKRK